jgi:hypothetical protein
MARINTYVPHSIHVLPDMPVGEHPDETDELGFETYARVLADAALGTEGPITIGVFGEWGSGKTSLLRLIKRFIDDSQAPTATVWFNAWRYVREEHPIVPLVQSIVDQLADQNRWRQKLVDGANDFLSALMAVASGLKAEVEVSTPMVGKVKVEYDVEKALAKGEKSDPDHEIRPSVYYQAFSTLHRLQLGARGGRIVVFVDDLDRCTPEQAIFVLETIKLSLDFSGFVFVLGAHRGVIDGFIKSEYRKRYDADDIQPTSYLDKLVQLSFHIPPHTERFDKYLRMIISRISRQRVEGLIDVLPLVRIASKDNPRAAVRFINNLIIDRHIAHRSVTCDKNVGIEAFAVLRVLQQHSSRAIKLILALGSACEVIANWGEPEIESCLEAETETLETRRLQELARLMKDDPILQNILLSSQGRNWLSNSNLRQASVHFLHKQRGELYIEAGEALTLPALYCSVHNRVDEKIVKTISAAVKAAGLSIKRTEGLKGHSSWLSAVNADMNGCDAFVCFVGVNTAQTTLSKLECREAVRRRKEGRSRQLILVLLPGANDREGGNSIIPDSEEYTHVELTDREVRSGDYRKIVRCILENWLTSG